MRPMKKLALLFTLLSLFVLNSNAQQKQLFLNATVLSQPHEFHFGFDSSRNPGIDISAGFVSSIKTSDFIWEGQLSYMNVQSELYTDKFTATNPNDPFIPESATSRRISNELGIKAGLGYRFGTDKGKHSLTITAGATGYLPFLSKSKFKINDGDWSKSPRYTEDQFKYGILYGFYLKPTYQLAFGENSPWALNIFGEANLLWRNATDYGNPLFMAGGGIGVSYSLK